MTYSVCVKFTSQTPPDIHIRCSAQIAWYSCCCGRLAEHFLNNLSYLIGIFIGLIDHVDLLMKFTGFNWSINKFLIQITGDQHWLGFDCQISITFFFVEHVHFLFSYTHFGVSCSAEAILSLTKKNPIKMNRIAGTMCVVSVIIYLD